MTAMQSLAENGDVTAQANVGALLGDLKDAIGVYDQVVDLVGDATEQAVRKLVARALVNKGVAFGRLGSFEAAIEVYDQVMCRFGNATEPALRELAALAQRMKAEMESGGELT